MPMSTTSANALLLSWLNNVALPAWWTGTTGYITPHSASPGAAGTQATNEITSTGVTRVAVTKNGAGGWTVSGNGAVNVAQLIIGPKTAGADVTCTHLSFGELATGAGAIIAHGPLTPNVLLTNGTAIQLPATTGVVWTAATT